MINELEPEHQVIISFGYGKNDLGALHELIERIDEVLSESSVGELDGHEIAVDLSEGFLYLYGPNAEALFDSVHEVLSQADFMKGSNVILRFEDGTDHPLTYEVTI